uniref:Eyes absent homolog n=1 Tax=Globodera pallida TaxID=36090 RepID=A0A183BLB8_GLOPA
MTATKFEPGTQIPTVAHQTMLSSLGHSSSSGSSASSSATISSSSFPPTNNSPYCWPTDWNLAAAAMSRSAGLCSDSTNQIGALCAPSHSTYYGQMAAAAAVSASSSVAGGTVWYPHNNFDYYDGLQLQRPAGHTLNGYLGTYGGGGAYTVPAGYYGASFPAASHYAAAAALSSTFDMKKYSNMTGTLVTDLHQPQQSVGTESDKSLVGGAAPAHRNGANNGRSVGLQQHSSPPASAGGRTAFSENIPRGDALGPPPKKAKTELKTPSAKRSKKKKVQATVNAGGAGGGGGTRASPTEPSNTTKVYVWELEDICSLLSPSTPVEQLHPDLDNLMSFMLNRLLQNGFQLETQDEYEQTNVEDAFMNEAPQNHLCATASGEARPLDEFGASNVPAGGDTGQHSPRRHQKQDFIEVPSSLLANNHPNSSAASTARPPPNNNGSINEGLRNLAAKYKFIRDTYKCRGGQNLEEWLQHCRISPDAYRQLETQFTFAKTGLFRQCLRVVAERSPLNANGSTNVVWSSAGNVGVAGALAKLMLFRMSEFVPAENVYCTARVGIEAVLERVANHFQRKYITIISSKAATRQLAEKECIPCWKLVNDQCVANLLVALDILLGDLGGTNLVQRTLPNGRRFGGVQPPEEDEETAERKGGGAVLAPIAGGGTTGTAVVAGGFLTARGWPTDGNCKKR